MKNIILGSFLSGCFFSSLLCAAAQSFPSQMVVEFNHQKNVLMKMGETERKGVYEVILYLQNPVFEPSYVLYFELLSNKEISQIDLSWKKSQTAEEVKNLFKEDFKSALDKVDRDHLTAEIDAFLKVLPGMNENDILTFRWYPGGTIEVRKGKEKKGEIKNAKFAKALWYIWLGPSSIIKREQLISNYENLDVPSD